MEQSQSMLKEEDKKNFIFLMFHFLNGIFQKLILFSKYFVGNIHLKTILLGTLNKCNLKCFLKVYMYL